MEKLHISLWPDAWHKPAAEAAPEAAGTATTWSRAQLTTPKGREQEQGFQEGSRLPFLGQFPAPANS